ncbi:MAG TPA: hypothetical protein DEQ47_05270 [Solibacterales bacterium]|nr:hypothetical protein [Bryobacterales bacterium]
MRVFSCFLALLLAAAPLADASTASHLYRQARKAEKHGQFAQAFLLYSQAAAANPANRTYSSRAEAVRRQAAEQSPPQVSAGAPELNLPAEDPAQVFDSLTEREYAAARQPRPPVELQATAGTLPVEFDGTDRQLFEQVARAFGLDVLFDGDYQPGPPIHFHIGPADYRVALHLLEAATNSFLVPLGPRLMLVARDTPAKRNDLEQTVTVVTPVPTALQNRDLVEITQAVRQAVGVEKIAWDTKTNFLIIRDRVSRALAAQAVIEDLLAYRAQTIADVEFLQVSESDLLNIGIDWQNSFSVAYLGHVLRGTGTIGSTLQNLVTIGGGRTMFGIGVADMSLIATLSESKANLLLKTQLRSSDGQAATLHVGDRYPILTAGYFGPASFSAGQTYTPPPSYTFEDLGITIKLTPHIHDMQETTLDLDGEFKILSGAGLNGIPIISSRKITSTVRLRNDEWALVAGLTTEGISKNWTSVWGLGNLSLIGPLFRHYTRDKERNHLLIAIRPRLLGLAPDQIVTREVRVGTETRTVSPL